jgi:hypothetical protein
VGRSAPRTRFGVAALAAVLAALGSCRAEDETTTVELVATRASASTVVFEPRGPLVAGSSLSNDQPLVLAYTPRQALTRGSRIVILLPTAGQEESKSLWSVPTLEWGAPGTVFLLGDGSSRATIIEAGRSAGGAGRIVVRADAELEPGYALRIALTGQVPRIVSTRPFRMFEIDARDGSVAALPPDRAPVAPLVAAPAETVAVSLPADAVAGQAISLRLAALDRFGNVATQYMGRVTFANPPQGLAPEYQFTPSDGGLKVFPGIRASTEGLIRVSGRASFDGGDREIASNPMRVWGAQPVLRRFFGDAHFHTGSDVAKLTTPGGDHRGQFVVSEDAYRYLRYVAALDWGISAEHDTGLTASTWEDNKRRVDQYNESGSFVSLHGFEWTPERRLGHHVVAFAGDPPARDPLVGASSGKRGGEGSASVAELATALRAAGDRVLLIPHIMQPFPNGDAAREDREHPHETWDGPVGSPHGAYVFNDLRRVGEIYSHHNDDFTPGDYDQTPEGSVDQPGLFELGAANPWSYQHAWASGHRIGVVAGSDNHLGTPGMNNFSPLVQHHAGLTVVLADGLSREAVFEALYARRCYATTGPKIWLDFTVDGARMGSDLRRPEGAHLEVAARVEGTAPLTSVELVAFEDGDFKTIANAEPDGGRLGASLFARVAFLRPILLYLRVRQADGEWAWSSPIWVDRA